MPRISSTILEVIATRPTTNPITISGAGVSQVVLEALCQKTQSPVRISQIILEILTSQAEGAGGSGSTPPTPDSAVTTIWVTVG